MKSIKSKRIKSKRGNFNFIILLTKINIRTFIVCSVFFEVNNDDTGTPILLYKGKQKVDGCNVRLNGSEIHEHEPNALEPLPLRTRYTTGKCDKRI